MDGEHIVGSSFLFEADPHISMATSTSASINSAQSEPLGTVRTNWTHGVSCSSLDQVYHIQNDLYWRHINSGLILSLYAVVCSIGTIMNLLVVMAFAKVPQIRNLRNYFIVNLAMSDLLLCTITAPATLYLTLNLFWPFGQLACQIVASIQAVNMFVSCLTLVLIAFDRFLLTLCPVRWRLAARAPIICYLFVWLASVVVATPYFFAVSAEDATMFGPWNLANTDTLLRVCDRRKPQICIEKTWDRLPFSRRTYTLTVLAVQYILPLGALGFAYSQIGSTIRRREKYNTTIDNQRRQLLTKRSRKAMLLLLSLVIVYATTWLPINAYNVLNVLEFIEFSQHRYIFCHLIGMCSTCLNPVMYAMINDAFRSALISLIQPLCSPCTKWITVIPQPQPNQHDHTRFSSSMVQQGCNMNNNPRMISFSKRDSEVHLVDTQELLLANGNSSVVKQNLENISNGHKVLENDNGKMERIYSCIEEEDEDDDTNVTQGSTHL